MSKATQSVLHGCPTGPQWRLVGVQDPPEPSWLTSCQEEDSGCPIWTL